MDLYELYAKAEAAGNKEDMEGIKALIAAQNPSDNMLLRGLEAYQKGVYVGGNKFMNAYHELMGHSPEEIHGNYAQNIKEAQNDPGQLDSGVYAIPSVVGELLPSTVAMAAVPQVGVPAKLAQVLKLGSTALRTGKIAGAGAIQGYLTGDVGENEEDAALSAGLSLVPGMVAKPVEKLIGKNRSSVADALKRWGESMGWDPKVGLGEPITKIRDKVRSAYKEAVDGISSKEAQILSNLDVPNLDLKNIMDDEFKEGLRQMGNLYELGSKEQADLERAVKMLYRRKDEVGLQEFLNFTKAIRRVGTKEAVEFSSKLQNKAKEAISKQFEAEKKFMTDEPFGYEAKDIPKVWARHENGLKMLDEYSALGDEYRKLVSPYHDTTKGVGKYYNFGNIGSESEESLARTASGGAQVREMVETIPDIPEYLRPLTGHALSSSSRAGVSDINSLVHNIPREVMSTRDKRYASKLIEEMPNSLTYGVGNFAHKLPVVGGMFERLISSVPSFTRTDNRILNLVEALRKSPTASSTAMQIPYRLNQENE